jgi:hypothetical protein
MAAFCEHVLVYSANGRSLECWRCRRTGLVL